MTIAPEVPDLTFAEYRKEKIKQLKQQNAILREALEEIATKDYSTANNVYGMFGWIAKQALQQVKE